MKFCALDLSLTATGVATSEGVVTTLRSPAKGAERLDQVQRETLRICQGADLVVIEGYSFGSKFSRGHAAGELGGVVRLGLHRAHVPFAVVPPASLKMYATGKGNARKEEMLQAAFQRLGYTGAENDEADASWLLQMALAYYRQDGAVDVPQKHQKALRKIDWPDLGIPTLGEPKREQVAFL